MTALDILLWIAGGAGGLGLGGLIVLAFVAPEVAGLILKGGARALRAVLATRIGCAVLAAIAAGAAVGIYQHVELTAACDLRIAELQVDAARAAAERDRAVRRSIESKYQPELDRLASEKTALEQQAEDYAKTITAQLAKGAAGAGVCRLGADALRMRQQAIATATARRPADRTVRGNSARGPVPDREQKR